MNRHLIAVDIESSGLDPLRHTVLEVAAVRITPEMTPPKTVADDLPQLRFVPRVSPADIGKADPGALQVNRYYERGLFREQLDHAETVEHASLLADMLADAIIVGANPSFDTAFLWSWLKPLVGLHSEPWWHRKYDISCATMAVLGLAEPPGLAKACEMWDIEHLAPHTALGDAQAAAACYEAISAYVERQHGAA